MATSDETFRYPVDRNGALSLHVDFERIDFANLNHQMIKFAFLLELITVDLEAQREFVEAQIAQALDWAGIHMMFSIPEGHRQPARYRS